jgi:hypothetical protein
MRRGWRADNAPRRQAAGDKNDPFAARRKASRRAAAGAHERDSERPREERGRHGDRPMHEGHPVSCPSPGFNDRDGWQNGWMRGNHWRHRGQISDSRLYQSKGKSMICHQNARVRVLATAIAAALTLFGLSSRSALAASITVNTTNMKYVADAQCGLAEAINAVNIGKAFDGCTAPNGNKDTINVMTAGTYTAQPGFPLQIKKSVIINGLANLSGIGIESGAVQTIVSSAALGTTASAALFEVDDGGTSIAVTFNGLLIEGVGVLNENGQGITGIWGNQGTASPPSTIVVESSGVNGFTNSAIATSGFSLTVTSSVVNANTALDGAGINFQNGPTLSVSASSIVQNTATDQAGGGILYLGYGTSSVTSSTIVYNSAPVFGAGIYSDAPGGSLAIVGSTIAMNTLSASPPPATAGQIAAYAEDSPATYSITQSIVSGENSAGPYDIDSDGSLTVTNSLVYWYDASNPPFINGGGNVPNPNLNPANFDPLGNGPETWGGPGEMPMLIPNIVPLDPTGGSSSSTYEQVVNAPDKIVDYLKSYAGAATDQRGFPRGVSQFGTKGPTGQSGTFDLGAFEYDPHRQVETMHITSSNPAWIPYTITSKTPDAKNFYNGAGIELPGTAVNDYVTFYFDAPIDGCYHVWVRTMTSTDGAEFELQYSTKLNGTYTNWAGSGVKDTYSSSTGYPVFDMGYSSAAFTQGTNVYFKFLVTGHNPANTSHLYDLYLDYLDVVYEKTDDGNNCTVP